MKKVAVLKFESVYLHSQPLPHKTKLNVPKLRQMNKSFNINKQWIVLQSSETI